MNAHPLRVKMLRLQRGVALLWMVSSANPLFACTGELAEVSGSVEAAYGALRSLDYERFLSEVDAASAALACLDAAPDEWIGAVRRLDGVRAFLAGDKAASLRAFAEARALDPAGDLPAGLYPGDHPLRRLYDAAPALSPAMLAGAPGTPPPLVVPEDDGVAPRRSRRPALAGAAFTGATAGGLWLASTLVHTEVVSAEDPADGVRELLASTQQRDALRFAAAGTAAVSAGLLTLGLVFRW